MTDAEHYFRLAEACFRLCRLSREATERLEALANQYVMMANERQVLPASIAARIAGERDQRHGDSDEVPSQTGAGRREVAAG